MKKALKITGVIVLVLAVLFAAWFVDNLVYPFKSESPNYSDVEKAFAKLQFPSDWKEISSSENRGLHGRGCNPFNDAGCFHKDVTFKVPNETTVEQVKSVLISAGCPGVVILDIGYGGDIKPSSGFSCGIGNGIKYDASLRGPRSEVYVGASTN